MRRRIIVVIAAVVTLIAIAAIDAVATLSADHRKRFGHLGGLVLSLWCMYFNICPACTVYQLKRTSLFGVECPDPECHFLKTLKEEDYKPEGVKA